MRRNTMSKHTWAQENVAAYVAGGLDAGERERLEQHAAECGECASALDETRAFDHHLGAAFAGVQPDAALEDRMIQRLRLERSRRGWRPSKALVSVMGAAAGVLLMVLGAAISGALQDGELPLPGNVDLTRLSPIAFWDDSGATFSSVTYTVGSVDGWKAAKELNDSKWNRQSSTTAAPDINEAIRDIREKSVLNDPLVTTDLNVGESMMGGLGMGGGMGGRSETPQFEPKSEKLQDRMETPAPNDGAVVLPVSPPVSMPQPTAPPLPAILSPVGADRGTGQQSRQPDVQYAPGFANPSMNWAVPNSTLAGSPSRDGDTKSRTKLGADLYFIPGADPANPKTKLDRDVDDLVRSQKDSKAPPSVEEAGEKKGSEVAQNKPAETKSPAQVQAESPPPSVQRRIIRTGEIEFEVKSFDDAVASISSFVRATKGGFIATINSDKLPNGKVRGSVVIRVPPEELDDLVLNLRKKLTEAGELKGQRIGSQDITKQYTDLESRLRASRTMEERLLKIIRDGKGEIKELLQAEKELGVWRIKIEEMEGELRYYSNQVSLSTLTIILAEKEIRNAAVITENERIQAGIEVEDVEAAFREALDAVLKANGRVSRSEMKQHAAGQFNAVLHFEVAPESAGVVRDRLKQLGNMVRLEIDRVQQTEDGQPAPRDGKIKRGDTQFLVSIYNLANVAPRETVILRIAAVDVPETYQKLREAIGVVKSRVANLQLNVQNQQNISAQLDFDVRRSDEAAMQSAIKNAGEVLSRNVTRSPENDNVTDAKVGYRIELVNILNVQARETITQRVAAARVNEAYEKLRAAIHKLGGHIFGDQLNVQDQQNVTAQLDFAVRRTDEGAAEAAIKDAGESISRHVARLPQNESTTDSKVAYRVQLVSVNVVPARETVTMRLAVAKVSEAYEKLREAISKAKGHVVNDQLNVQDQQNVTAKLDFNVRRSEEGAMRAALQDAGEAVSRHVTRLAENENITDSKVAFQIELVSIINIPARETITLQIAATNVTEAYDKLRAAVANTTGRLVNAQLNAQEGQQVTADVDFDVRRGEEEVIRAALKEAGAVLSRQVNRRPEGDNVTDGKVTYNVKLTDANNIRPRETVTLGIDVSDVEGTQSALTAKVKEAGGRVVDAATGLERNGRVTAILKYDVPLTAKADVVEAFKKSGTVRVQTLARDPQAPEGELAQARIELHLSNGEMLLPRDQGLWAQIRNGLSFSLVGLMYSVSLLIIGVLFVLPWVLVIWAIIWVVRRLWRNDDQAPIAGGSAPVA